LKELLGKEQKLTFLIGAGCSVNKPSFLPAGRAMMDALIGYTCAKSEVENIKGLKELRFEALVESLEDYTD
jgi:hypothetical protein